MPFSSDRFGLYYHHMTYLMHIILVCVLLHTNKHNCIW